MKFNEELLHSMADNDNFERSNVFTGAEKSRATARFSSNCTIVLVPLHHGVCAIKQSRYAVCGCAIRVAMRSVAVPFVFHV